MGGGSIADIRGKTTQVKQPKKQDIVIKSEYYFGTKCWWVFALAGAAFIAASLLAENGILSPVLGVIGCSCFWSILEIFEQKKRVEKGWFPMNPKRRKEYQNK